MKQVFANSYHELRRLYPFAFAIKREPGGGWSGVIEENRHEANASSCN
jgi:hypothetical protein